MVEVYRDGDYCPVVFDKAEDIETCKHKKIVLNAYCGLCKCGVGHCEAIKIAARLLKLHHPAPTDDVQTVVECWVFKNSNQSVN
jgi:hypothetical protein